VHIAAIDKFQQLAKDVVIPEVNPTHDHTSHCDTSVVLELRKTLSGNGGSAEITFERIAKTKRK
jgi:hypothetical protein